MKLASPGSRATGTAALLLLLLAPSPASPRPYLGPGEIRHTELRTAEPAPGSNVEGEVRELRLSFTTAVQLRLSRVTVAGTMGEMPTGDLDLVDDSQGRDIRVPLPAALPPGGYRVTWQTAGPDSHIIRGDYTFSVASPAAGATFPQEPEPADTLLEEEAAPPEGALPPPPAAAQPLPGEGTTAGVVIRWLFYLGIVLTVGATAFRLLALPALHRDRALGPLVVSASDRLRLLGWVGALLALAALPGRLWVQVAAGGGGAGVGGVANLVFGTPWGYGWLLHLGGLALAMAGLLLTAPRGERTGGWVVVGVGGALLALVPSLSGHAATIEPRSLGLSLNFLHVIGASVWMGGLGALLMAGIPALKSGERDEGGGVPGLGALVNGYSRMALPAVVVILLSGSAQNFFLLGSPGNLVTTEWGRALLVKLGILTAAVALGLYNWRVVRPALKESPRPGLVRIPATVEFLLGLGVLLATAILVMKAVPGNG